ncbi:Outer membrane protein assembly factor BamB [Komagataeibacter saccharivorans]|uniref:PQQ-like beta-propeller repeat protein n=1 Tax=Komagataeibacter saccharivorans TaxID=265959 RepID=UPI001052F23B|nr:PQQ-like beta-propeller repeat protein [Komagataeibacter saccharivorans]QBL93020.1 Outer membrane protein assembly factor BamB [Komagataeibacter saccharivorans]
MKSVLSRRHALLGVGAALLPALAACKAGKKKTPLLIGHRSDVLHTVAGLTVDADETQAVTVPAAIAVNAWPQSGIRPDHDGVNIAWGGEMRHQWTHDIGAGNSEPQLLSYVALGDSGRGIIQATPVVQNGRIFVADAQGVIRAYRWPGMHKLWEYNPKPRKMLSNNLGGGLTVDGDTLYIVDGVGQALAVSAETGKLKWRVNIQAPGRSAPTLVNGRLFFGTIDEHLYCVDAENGNILWSYAATSADTVIYGQPAPAVADGVVLAGFGSGDLVALRAEGGEVVWADTLGSTNGQEALIDFSCVHGMPVIVDGTAYAISTGSVLVAIDMRSGRRLWERGISGQNTPLVIGDWIFLVSMDEQVACLDRLSGHVRWITQLRQYENADKQKRGIVWNGPILAGGKLVMISSLPENGVAIIDPAQGHIESLHALPGQVTTAPIIVDNLLLLMDNKGYLIAYS